MSPNTQHDNTVLRKVELPEDGRLTSDFVFKVFTALQSPAKPFQGAMINRFWRTLVTACNNLKILNEKCEHPGCDAQAGTCEHANWNVWAAQQKISIAKFLAQKDELARAIEPWGQRNLAKLLKGIEYSRQGDLFYRQPVTKPKKTAKAPATTEYKQPFEVRIGVDSVIVAKIRMRLTPRTAKDAQVAGPNNPAADLVRRKLLHERQYADHIPRAVKDVADRWTFVIAEAAPID